MKKFETKIKSLFVLLLVASSAVAAEVKFEKDTAIPMVYLNVAVKAGSAHDPEGRSGITNFMGEMLLRGTQKRNKSQLDLALDQIGAKLGAETRTEALILRGAVVSSKLPEFMEILSEVVTSPRFAEQDIRRLKTEVVSNILETRGRDPALARKKWENFLFEGHPYGNSISGKVRDIESISRTDVQAQYRRLFQKGQILVVGSGDAEESFIEAWAKRVSDALPSDGKPIEKVAAPTIPQKLRIRIIDKPDRTQTQMYIGQAGVRMDDPRFFPLYVGNHTLGGGSFSARLMTEIRAKRGWSYGAHSYFRHSLQPRSWQAFTFPASKDTPDALALMIQMLKDMKEKGVTEQEFEFARSSMVNRAGFMFNTPRKRVENILLEKTLELPDDFMKSYGPKIAATSRAGVNQAWSQFLKPEQFSILILGTAKDLKPKIAKALGIPEGEIEVESYMKE